MGFCKHGPVTERYASGKCKPCAQERMRSYYQRNKVKRRDYARERAPKQKQYHYEYHLKRTYGITLEQFNERLASQGGKCAICPSVTPGSTRNRWHIDHCHDTGEIRGILCAPCNVMIGMARDDTSILSAAIKYLEADRAAH